MESAALLSPTDIHTIRRYVQTKYAPLPDGRRAEIVADAIRRALSQRMPNVPEDLKRQMIDRLISRCLVGEKRNIHPEDVLDLFAEIGEDDERLTERLLEPILQWANERTQRRWSPEQLASRLERRQGPVSLAAAEAVTIGLAPEGATTASRSGWSAAVWAAVRSLAKPAPAIVLASVIALGGGAVWIASGMARPAPVEPPASAPSPVLEAVPAVVPDVGIPAALKYTKIDVPALVAYLSGRDSMLAEEPYFGIIMDTAREYDLHPHLLFAITGQEQGFVPKSAKHALKIANNPFNVGHSWMEYNTDIANSAGIAARLLVKLGDSRPEGHDPFEWFNRTYAEDPLWSVGVRKIFDKLNGLGGE